MTLPLKLYFLFNQGYVDLNFRTEFCKFCAVETESNPKTLHALTGSLVAERIFGENKAVVDAIRWHTTGHPDMDQLARIIYISDYIEPGRNFPGVDVLRQITNKDLNLGVLAGLDHTLTFLIQRNHFIHPLSIAARNRMLEEHVVEDLS